MPSYNGGANETEREADTTISYEVECDARFSCPSFSSKQHYGINFFPDCNRTAVAFSRDKKLSFFRVKRHAPGNFLDRDRAKS